MSYVLLNDTTFSLRNLCIAMCHAEIIITIYEYELSKSKTTKKYYFMCTDSNTLA